VLIVHGLHAGDMTALLIVLLGLVLVLLAPLYGVDSRIHDDRDRRGWWPGTRPR